MDIRAAWDIIERTLAREAPTVAASLRPPASDEALARLAEAVGQPLPADLVASLKIHDGQDNPTRLIDLFDHVTLLSVDAMVDNHQMRAAVLGADLDSDDYAWMVPDKVRTIPNARGWLQFTDTEGQGWAVDLVPLPTGRVGQVIWLPVDGPTPEPIVGSYAAWLTRVATLMQEGAYAVDDENLRLRDSSLYD